MKRLMIIVAVLSVVGALGLCDLEGAPGDSQDATRKQPAYAASKMGGSARQVKSASTKKRLASAPIRREGRVPSATSKFARQTPSIPRFETRSKTELGARAAGARPKQSVAHVASLPSPTTPKTYEATDLGLLQEAAHKARTEGSRIAYIGRLQELYAFEPAFFSRRQDVGGETQFELVPVESVETVQTNAGQRRLHVQRLPFAIASAQAGDYNQWHRAIIEATATGVKVINLTTAGLDRSRLDSSIQYARSRGIVVLTVAPVN